MMAQLLMGRILEQETLDSQWDPCLVLDLGLDILNHVRGLDLVHEALASNGLDDDFHL